ncbi:MAG: hypothetical protein O3A25_12745 [Acidobacteria bacterium]|nr:hypothetical protein [Acidobacteriota bacterium]
MTLHIFLLGAQRGCKFLGALRRIEPERLWAAARADAAPWAFAVEPSAQHSDEQTLTASHSLMLPWIVAIVDKRTGSDSASLRDVDLSTGWRVDQGTGQMRRYGGSQGVQPLSSWLPDEETAKGWQMVSGKK